MSDTPADVTIRPWVDPIVDRRGHDPRSHYAERYWLSVIGPTAMWIMRRFAEHFDTQPDGFMIDLDHAANTMGLSYSKRMASPFGRALNRCVMFGLAQPHADGFIVRRRLPTVPLRHLKRLPDDVQSEHEQWARRIIQLDVGDVERRLVAAGLPATVAVRATESALRCA
jgi:hypothetical protein